MLSLSGKKALITGATGGLGEAMADLFVQLGAQVALSGTNQDKVSALVDRLGEQATGFVCNLADTKAVESLIPAVEGALGGVDIVVCNAGITRDGLAMRMKDEDWDSVLQVNLTSSFRLMRASMKGMIKQRYGRLIGVASVVGVKGNAGQANYCASKAGMIGMCKALAAETATRGITVNCVAPGFIASAMTDALNDTQRERILGNIPAGRMGTAQDIAQATAFLASDAAAYITGQTLHVNGGMLMV